MPALAGAATRYQRYEHPCPDPTEGQHKAAALRLLLSWYKSFILRQVVL
jgi:hypothetical protein